MSINKPFLSFPQQIQILKSQGLTFGDEKYASRILTNHSYYSLVNAYCDLLVGSKSPRIFKAGATFEELVAIYNFDTSIRRFLFPQILYIEEKLKAAMIHHYCAALKPDGSFLHNEDDYLVIDNYEISNVYKKKATIKLVSDFTKAFLRNDETKPFEYAMSKYGYVPFWVFAAILTFGQISRFYECNLPRIRVEVANIYRLNEDELRSALKIINCVRNCCAHNNRIFCTHIPTILPKTIGKGKTQIAIDSACNQKFGSLLFCLSFLLSKGKFTNVIDELSIELKKLKSELTSIAIESVLKKMGISKGIIKTFGIQI